MSELSQIIVENPSRAHLVLGMYTKVSCWALNSSATQEIQTPNMKKERLNHGPS